MVDNVSIFELLEEYRAYTWEIDVDSDKIPRGGLYFDGERLYFDPYEVDVLDDEKVICMIDTRASV